MGQGFWRGLGYSFVVGSILNFLLVVGFNIFQRLGVIQAGANNLFPVLGVYGVALLVYALSAVFYFKYRSAKNLEKLKQKVDSITSFKTT